MSRKARMVIEERAFHVMCQGNNKQVVFRCDNDKWMYYSLLFKYKNVHYIRIYHYCLMDNHVHLLVWLPRGGDMARFMQQVNLTYSLYFKKTYGYCGHLWRDRFQSKLIEHDSYLLQCGYYIETNPVRAGIAAEPERYEFSSYRFYCYGQDDKLVTCNPLVKGGMLEYRFMKVDMGIIGKSLCVG